MNIIRSLCVYTLAACLAVSVAVAGGPNTSSQFHGAKANTGTVSFYKESGKSVLKVSPDFKVPDTPAPTWRVVDSKGNIYTLDAFKVDGGEKREVVVPSYIHDVAKVQVYCAWAQVLLGEATFPSPVM